VNVWKRNATRRKAAGQRSSKVGQQSAHRTAKLSRGLKAFSSNPLITAVFAALVTCVGTWAVTHEFDVQNQGAANAATIQADRSQQAAQRAERLQAVRAEAEHVTYGISPVPGAPQSEPELIVENRSDGWVRDIMLYIPLPNSKTINVGNPAGVAWASYGLGPYPFGEWLAMELPDIPPCEVDAVSLLRLLPNLQPDEMEHSTMFFTDSHSRQWGLRGTGLLAPYPIPPILRDAFGQSLGGFAWASDSRMATISGGCMAS
jgi:hypothetical protein